MCPTPAELPVSDTDVNDIKAYGAEHVVAYELDSCESYIVTACSEKQPIQGGLAC